MTVRTRYLVAAALGLCAAHLLPAQEPGRLGLERNSPLAPRSANQQLADTVACQLGQGGQLHNYQIDIICREGLVELTGSVADQLQREEAVRLVQGVPGVERVLDRLTLSSDAAVQQAQAGAAPPPLPPAATQPPELGPPPKGGPAEPMPLFQAPPPAPYDLNPPRMPSYAWPTYAPYNNFSRVAYPLAYPYNAWPFIGPCYPFPKIPPGWRSVKLEWEDGYWWFSRTATKYDWWRLRYW
ncbi:MAG TPA: BON domain-containing protein [Gemmataceae bacterium]|nr:BON domain-containing protein [Gemmataceae bacterium]